MNTDRWKIKALVLEPVPVNHRVKILAGILGGAGAEAVQSQGIFIVVPVAVLVLAACVQLAEHQLPVVAALRLVPVLGTAPAEVLHLNGLVLVAGDGDEVAVALPGLVDGVGQDLKDGVLTAVQTVRAEDDPRGVCGPGRLPSGRRWRYYHIVFFDLPFLFPRCYNSVMQLCAYHFNI